MLSGGERLGSSELGILAAVGVTKVRTRVQQLHSVCMGWGGGGGGGAVLQTLHCLEMGTVLKGTSTKCLGDQTPSPEYPTFQKGIPLALVLHTCYVQVKVLQRPKVAVLSTGNEVRHTGLIR